MSKKCRPVRLAVDIGGTFTDIVLLAGEQRLVAKVLTTPRAPEVAVIEGARSALVATDGFRDVIEIADEGRFDQYDINIVKPQPLVPRELRFTVPERMDVHGAVRRPLDEAAVSTIARRLGELGIEAVAVALIHAYANPAHEARVGAMLAELCPRISVT